MQSYKEIPVLVTAYDRPGKLARVLQHLAGLGMRNLFVACDGPKGESDRDQVAACMAIARNYVAEDARVLVRDKNLGCYRGMFEAISWFLGMNDLGVVNEDDILIKREYFQFLFENRALLERPDIFQVNSFGVPAPHVPEHCWYESSFVCPWGWATTAAKWASFRHELDMGEAERSAIAWAVGDWKSRLFFRWVMTNTRQAKASSWAYRWCLSVWRARGYAVTPGRSLAQNIGLDNEATHTSGESHLIAMGAGSPAPVLDSTVMSRSLERDTEVWTFYGRIDGLPRLVRLFLSTLLPRRLFFFVRHMVRSA